METIILLNEGTEIEVTQGIGEIDEKIENEIENKINTNYIILMRKEETRFLYFFRDVHYYQIRLNLKRILLYYKKPDAKK